MPSISTIKWSVDKIGRQLPPKPVTAYINPNLAAYVLDTVTIKGIDADQYLNELLERGIRQVLTESRIDPDTELNRKREPDREFDPWGQHPKYPRSDWADEVRSDGTWIGYWDWVESQLEDEAQDDTEN
jgi:hypothetical protein